MEEVKAVVVEGEKEVIEDKNKVDGSCEQAALSSEGASGANEKYVGTLYITIGVQCAGKSTALKKLSCSDIALDDHDGIYKQVPWSSLPTGTQGRVVWEAITCPAEDPTNVKENWIAKFQASIPQKGFHPAKRAELSNQLWEAVERLRQDNLQESEISPTFDQLNFNLLGQAIAGSTKRLEDAMSSGVDKVAWGNTNRFLTDMYGAVLLAQKYNYKIEFLIFNEVPFKELLYRNVRRGMTTGKYIPVEIMWRAKGDVDRTVKDGVTVEKIVATKGDRSLNNPHNHNNTNNQKRQPRSNPGSGGESGGEGSGGEGKYENRRGRGGRGGGGRGGGGRGGGRGRGGYSSGGEEGGGGGYSPSPPKEIGNMFAALEDLEGGAGEEEVLSDDSNGSGSPTLKKKGNNA